MDKIIDTFYNSSINNNGYHKSRLTSNKFSSPNLLENRYNRNNYNNNDNQRYKNGQRIMNTPIPKTNYSIGLNVPHPPSTTIPFQNNDVNTYSFLQKNYPDNILKMNILDTRIKQMEDENKRDKLKIQRLLEGSTFSPNDNQFPQNNFNRTYIYNPSSLQQAMDNLRNPYLTLEEISQKQALRREQVQLELDKARQRLNEERLEKERERIIRNQKREKNYTISNYSEDSEGEEDEESKSQSYETYSKSNNYTNYSKNSSIKNHTHYTNKYDDDEKYKKLKKKIKKKEKVINSIKDNLNQVIDQNNYNNEEINQLRIQNEEMINALKSKEEAEDFINNIPDHVALQLQNDNFKIRSNLASIKEGFKEIKNELENKLEALQMKQNMNFEVIRKIIEEGGNKKTNAGLRKYFDGEDIDLNNIEGELPEYLKYLPALIEKKIKENDERKNEEKNRQINEEINKKYDMMEYKYGYANGFYDYKNNYKPTIVQNKNQNPNFIISKNYGRYQYIAPNNKNNKKPYNSFRQNAENNLKIIKEKENMIAGRYAYGVGNKNMDSYVPIKMNGCFDDWYKSKKNGDKKYDGEFQVENSISEENKNRELVGINAIKKRVNSKSEKTESKSHKSKESKKDKKNKNKSEVSETVSVSKTKSSKVSKKTKSSKSKKEESSKKSKKENKENKKEDKKKEKEKKKKKKENEEEEEESDDDKEENEEDDDNDNNEEKEGSNSNEDNEENENEEDKESSGNNNEENSGEGDNEENSGSGSGDDNEENSGSGSGDDNEENGGSGSGDNNEENNGSGSGDNNEEKSGSGDDDEENKSSDESSSN